MKNPLAIAFASIVLTGSLGATATLNISAGNFRDGAGVELTTSNTLWALIEADGVGNLPGGLGLNESLTTGDAEAAYLAFNGATIAVDLLVDGAKIFAVGETDVVGFGPLVFEEKLIDVVGKGLTVGKDVGLYWFPGLTLASNVVNPLNNPSFEIGGIHDTTAPNGGIGTVVPADPGTSAMTVVSTDSILGDGSSLDPVRFNAINAIPEPSTALLALLGLGLLRRRR